MRVDSISNTLDIASFLGTAYSDHLHFKRRMAQFRDPENPDVLFPRTSFKVDSMISSWRTIAGIPRQLMIDRNAHQIAFNLWGYLSNCDDFIDHSDFQELKDSLGSMTNYHILLNFSQEEMVI